MRATGTKKKKTECSRSLNAEYMTVIFANVSGWRLKDRDTATWGEEKKRTIAEGWRSEAASVCFVSDGGAMIDDAVNDILLDRHFGGSIDNASG